MGSVDYLCSNIGAPSPGFQISTQRSYGRRIISPEFGYEAVEVLSPVHQSVSLAFQSPYRALEALPQTLAANSL